MMKYVCPKCGKSDGVLVKPESIFYSSNILICSRCAVWGQEYHFVRVTPWVRFKRWFFPVRGRGRLMTD